MTAVAYYRRAIWLPILLPILALPEYLMTYSSDTATGFILFDSDPPVVTIPLLLIHSLLWGGIPYLILIAFSWRNLRSAKAKDWKQFLATAPLQMLLPLLPNVLFILSIAHYLPRLDGSPVSGTVLGKTSIWVFLLAALATIIIGYLYVLLIHLQRKFLQLCGWVEV